MVQPYKYLISFLNLCRKIVFFYRSFFKSNIQGSNAIYWRFRRGGLSAKSIVQNIYRLYPL